MHDVTSERGLKGRDPFGNASDSRGCPDRSATFVAPSIGGSAGLPGKAPIFRLSKIGHFLAAAWLREESQERERERERERGAPPPCSSAKTDPHDPCRQPAAPARSAGISEARERGDEFDQAAFERGSPVPCRRSSPARSRPGSTASATASRARCPTPSMSATAFPGLALRPRRARQAAADRGAPRHRRSPEFAARLHAARAAPRGSPPAVPCCTGPVDYRDRRRSNSTWRTLPLPLRRRAGEAFMNAASPGSSPNSFPTAITRTRTSMLKR